MSRGKAGGALAAAIAAVALATAPSGVLAGDQGANAAGKKTVKVKVGDDYFAPSNLKVKKGTKVKWKWLSTNGNPHNVTLRKVPKSVKGKKKIRKFKKDFTSGTGTVGIKFNRKLKKTGKYKFVCTIHSTVMTQTIKVKK